MKQDKKIKKMAILAGIAALAAVGIVVYFTWFVGDPRTIKEDMTIPDTKSIFGTEGRMPSGSNVSIPLKPKDDSERVVVSLADLTIKGSHDVAQKEAVKWSSDAKLIFIKSLGAITLEGKSSQWQVVFGSALARSGYEVIIRGSGVISKKMIESADYGYNLPQNWYDSGDAIASLDMPQFNEALASSISFYYNNDGDNWAYSIATSRGVVSMKVR